MCWDCYDNRKGDPYKIFTQGGVEISDFEDEIPYRHPKRKSKKKSRKAVPGCEGNDGKAHIYVWTSETMPTDYLFYRYFGFHRSEWRVCVGCGKRNGTRNSEKYETRKEREYNKRYKPVIERGAPVSRRGRRYFPSLKYYNWEGDHDGYASYRKEYIKKHGYNSKVWGPSGWW